MKDLVFIVYDAFGDWISANGMIRYLSDSYEKIYLIHDTPVVVPFTENMFRDNKNIIPMEGLNISHSEYDVIDLRIHEVYSSPGGSGNYFNKINKFGRDSFTSKDNASSFYCELGLNPEIRIKGFDYERDIEKEEELYTSLNLPSKYSVICEMNEGMVERKYVNEECVVNLHRLTNNFMNTMKVIENASDVHLIENSISLFVYHLQHISKMKPVDINLHTYARQEPHRKCTSPDSDNLYLNMLKCPQLPNWKFI